MRAALFREYGGPEVLQLETVPDLEAPPGECLVRVEACGVEPGLDVITRLGKGNWNLTMPHVLGPASVGEVVVTTDGGPAVGDRVALIPAIPCRRCPQCRQGRQNACADRQIIGIHRWGGYAEYLAAPPENLVVLPSSADPVEAAAMPVTYATAWHMVTKRANVRPGDTVLVVGATGNVGYASAQVAKVLGARVILAGRGEERMRALAEELGGLEYVDVDGPEPAARVRELTGGQGAEVVVETVGPATWAMSLAAIAVEGRLVSAGGGSGTELQMNLPSIYRRNISMTFTSQGTHQDARDMFGAFARGLFHPRVGQVFPHSEVVEAHRAHAAPGGPMGKIVLRY